MAELKFTMKYFPILINAHWIANRIALFLLSLWASTLSFLCPRPIKVPGALCRRPCVGVRKHFGFHQITLTWNFFWWLLSIRGRFLSIMAAARYPRWWLWQPYWIWFPSNNLRTVQAFYLNFFHGCSMRGRFLSMMAAIACPRWWLWPPSWISFPSYNLRTVQAFDLNFFLLLLSMRGRFLLMIVTAAHPRWWL